MPPKYIYYSLNAGDFKLPERRRVKKSFMSDNFVPQNYKIVEGDVLELGSGAQGKVSAYYRNKTMTNLVAHKANVNGSGNVSEREADMNKIAYKICPRHVLKITEEGRYFHLFEVCKGGSLLNWLSKTSDADDTLIKNFIIQIVGTLDKLHSADPSFCHNDLHLGNIFVDDEYKTNTAEKFREATAYPTGVRLVLADFGWAADKNHPQELTPDYGINAYESGRNYDLHFFLNSLYGTCVGEPLKYPRTIRFIESIMKKYIGMNNKFLKNFRLKPNVKFPYTCSKLLSHPYIKDTMSNSKGSPFYINTLFKVPVMKKAKNTSPSFGLNRLFENSNNRVRINGKLVTSFKKKADLIQKMRNKGFSNVSNKMTVRQLSNMIKRGKNSAAPVPTVAPVVAKNNRVRINGKLVTSFKKKADLIQKMRNKGFSNASNKMTVAQLSNMIKRGPIIVSPVHVPLFNRVIRKLKID